MRTPQPSFRVMLSPHCTNQMNPVVSSQQLTLCIHCGGSMFFATPKFHSTKNQEPTNNKPKNRETTNSFSMFRIGEPFFTKSTKPRAFTNISLDQLYPPCFFGRVDLKWLWLTAPIWLPLLLINLVSKKWSNLLLMNAHQDQHSGVLG